MVFYWKTISLQQKSVHGFKIFTDLLRFRLQPVQPTLGTSHFFDLTDTFGAGRACEVLSQVRLQTTNAWEAIESSTNDPTHQEIGTECVCVCIKLSSGGRAPCIQTHINDIEKHAFAGPPEAHRGPPHRTDRRAAASVRKPTHHMERPRRSRIPSAGCGTLFTNVTSTHPRPDACLGAGTY